MQSQEDRAEPCRAVPGWAGPGIVLAPSLQARPGPRAATGVPADREAHGPWPWPIQSRPTGPTGPSPPAIHTAWMTTMRPARSKHAFPAAWLSCDRPCRRTCFSQVTGHRGHAPACPANELPAWRSSPRPPRREGQAALLHCDSASSPHLGSTLRGRSLRHLAGRLCTRERSFSRHVTQRGSSGAPQATRPFPRLVDSLSLCVPALEAKEAVHYDDYISASAACCSRGSSFFPRARHRRGRLREEKMYSGTRLRPHPAKENLECARAGKLQTGEKSSLLVHVCSHPAICPRRLLRLRSCRVY